MYSETFFMSLIFQGPQIVQHSVPPQFKKVNITKLGIDLITENLHVGCKGSAQIEANQIERHYQSAPLP